MKYHLTALRLFLCVLLFCLTFAGTTKKLQEYNESFYKSPFARPAFDGFEGIRFGITYEEFKQLVGEKDSLRMKSDTTVDYGIKGKRRTRVYMKGNGDAGSVYGKYYLFGLDLLGQEGVLGYAYFTPDEERLHRLLIVFPDRLYSDMNEIEVTIRQLYERFSKEYGIPDYVPGRKDGDWGPQKAEALTMQNLNHPRTVTESKGKTFSAWCSQNGEWTIEISGMHFKYDKHRYQAVLDLSRNYTKGF